MTTSAIYEILNDFLAFKDPTQILNLATHLEVFSSPTFGDGKIYTGQHAPEAFREAIKRHADAKKSTIKLGKTDRVGNDSAAVFVSEVKGKRGTQSSSLTIILRGPDMIGFLEMPSA